MEAVAMAVAMEAAAMAVAMEYTADRSRRSPCRAGNRRIRIRGRHRCIRH
jgi:hypothetical protein